MVTTRPLQVAGYCGPGLPNMPLGTMLLPADNEARFEHSRACVQAVLESGEYRYGRAQVEDVSTIVDVGFNLGAFTIWAVRCWWPGRIDRVYGYDPNRDAIEIAHELNTDLIVPGLKNPASIELKPWAVSLDARPRFSTDDNWGGGRTHGVTNGIVVPSAHPGELPPCDVFKSDAEGVDADVAEHYRHWAGVKVAFFEWHDREHRARIEAVCRAAGMSLLRAHDGDGQGQMIWGRR